MRQNIVRFVGLYNVLTHADLAFLQIFTWIRFGTISPQPVQFDAVQMIEIEVAGEIIEKAGKPYQPRAIR